MDSGPALHLKFEASKNIMYENLVDRNEIAYLFNIGPTAVSNYVSRTSNKYPAFPDAVITRSLGRFRLWHLNEIIKWHSIAFPLRGNVCGRQIDALDRLRDFRAGTEWSRRVRTRTGRPPGWHPPPR